MDDSKHTLLICTVGGSPEPIVATLKQWNPSRIRFLPTRETLEEIDARIIPLAQAEGLAFDPGRYDVLDLPDGQDFAACVKTLRRLTPVVEEWLARGDQFQVVVDFTGGTKCMSAALALQAHRWRCLFSYVGGTERSKEGVGVVISGKEQVLHAYNPWDAMGFQAVDDVITLFDQQAFAPAAALAERAMRNVNERSRKRELTALKVLADAYDAWDRFDHMGAASRLKDLTNYHNDLRGLLGERKAGQLNSAASAHADYLRRLIERSPPSMDHVTDLLANAQRRKAEGRIDDAVARLYRAIESLAQVALAARHQIGNTKKVPLGLVPEPLHGLLASRVEGEEKTVFLGLQDAYALLHARDDDLGKKFKEWKLDDRQQSPLVARNQSILAHGFERVSERVFAQLWAAAVQLSRVEEHDLIRFPTLCSGESPP